MDNELVLDLIQELDRQVLYLVDGVNEESLDPVQICALLVTIGEIAKLVCSLIKVSTVKES